MQSEHRSTPPRADATRQRRQAILGAALECFSTIGYEQTTLADIREKAGASTGSIYHHFGSKEQIAASLYLEGVSQTQEAGLEALLRTRTARTGVAAQVGAYIDWVVANPAMARFLFAMRHATFLDEEEPSIAAANADVLATRRQVDRGARCRRRTARSRTGDAVGDRVRTMPPLGGVMAARSDVDLPRGRQADHLDRGIRLPPSPALIRRATSDGRCG